MGPEQGLLWWELGQCPPHSRAQDCTHCMQAPSVHTQSLTHLPGGRGRQGGQLTSGPHAWGRLPVSLGDWVQAPPPLPGPLPALGHHQTNSPPRTF